MRVNAGNHNRTGLTGPEPWITPSIFQPWANNHLVVDEYTFTQTLGKQAASAQLMNHWKTWITQDDFNRIAQAGLNHVRIPIGESAALIDRCTVDVGRFCALCI